MITVRVNGPSKVASQLFKKYCTGGHTSGFPFIVFLDHTGSVLDLMGIVECNACDATKMISRIEQVLKKYGLDNTDKKILWADSFEKAAESSKCSGKPIALVFLDNCDDKEAIKPLTVKELEKDLGNFVFVKVKFDKGSDLVKKYKIESAPALALIDPFRDKPIESLTEKFTTANLTKAFKSGTFNIDWRAPKNEKELNKELKSAVNQIAIVLFYNSYNSTSIMEKKKISAILSLKLLENFSTEVTFCAANTFGSDLGSTLGKWGGKSTTDIVLVSGTGTDKETRTWIKDKTFTGIRHVIKDALSIFEWKCQNENCDKTFDEPSDCCGKPCKKVKKGSNSSSQLEEITLEVNGMS